MNEEKISDQWGDLEHLLGNQSSYLLHHYGSVTT